MNSRQITLERRRRSRVRAYERANGTKVKSYTRMIEYPERGHGRRRSNQAQFESEIQQKEELRQFKQPELTPRKYNYRTSLDDYYFANNLYRYLDPTRNQTINEQVRNMERIAFDYDVDKEVLREDLKRDDPYLEYGIQIERDACINSGIHFGIFSEEAVDVFINRHPEYLTKTWEEWLNRQSKDKTADFPDGIDYDLVFGRFPDETYLTVPHETVQNYFQDHFVDQPQLMEFFKHKRRR